jgi:hypothetical protein
VFFWSKRGQTSISIRQLADRHSVTVPLPCWTQGVMSHDMSPMRHRIIFFASGRWVPSTIRHLFTKLLFSSSFRWKRYPAYIYIFFRKIKTQHKYISILFYFFKKYQCISSTKSHIYIYNIIMSWPRHPGPNKLRFRWWYGWQQSWLGVVHPFQLSLLPVYGVIRI